jgi:hypothetical protein
LESSKNYSSQTGNVPILQKYGPQGGICTTCTDHRYYYDNDLWDKDTLPLLARLMASAIVKELEINIAQFYTESLIDYVIPEYYQPERPVNKNATKDPND